MVTNQNNELVNEIHHAAKLGQQAISDVMPKVTNGKLREKLEHQNDAYQRIVMRSGRMLSQSNEKPKNATMMEKLGMWSSVQMNTLSDNSTRHLAEMLIQGSNMAVTDITKTLNDLPDADAGAKELAEEYLRCEEKHIDELKKYL